MKEGPHKSLRWMLVGNVAATIAEHVRMGPKTIDVAETNTTIPYATSVQLGMNFIPHQHD